MFFVAAVLAGLSATLLGQAPPPGTLLGTWRLNLAKSIYDPGPSPYKRSTCRIEPTPDGLKVTYDMVGVRGGVTHLEWTGKLDGRDYDIEGLDQVLTNAYIRVDDFTYDIVVKSDGVKAATARVSISPDGRVLTTVTHARNVQGQPVATTTVYDRQ